MVTRTFVSCFAGVGGFDSGLERAGLKCVRQVEIDPTCRRVLDHHWPEAPKHDDVTTYQGEERSPGLLCGGFPCQDVSLAGRRAGLAGKRSGLFFEFARIAEKTRPRWVLVENVPGLLSSNEGRDMGAVLGALGELGYGWAYRVLDAQYFGLAQRRERVFIVGRLGDRSRAAKVLFEPESVSWDPPPGREAGSGTASSLTASTGSRNGQPGKWGEVSHNLVPDSARCVTTGTSRRYDGDTEDFIVTHALRSEGADASEDGTGRGTPLAVVYNPYRTSLGTGKGFVEGFKPDGVADAVTASEPPKGRPVVVRTNRTASNGGNVTVDGCPTLEAGEQPPAVLAFNGQSGGKKNFVRPNGKTTSALGTTQTPSVAGQFGVRRLTPLECSRLMGFPDDWLDLDPPLSDSAKYRVLGNAVCPPVALWIAKRIVQNW